MTTTDQFAYSQDVITRLHGRAEALRLCPKEESTADLLDEAAGAISALIERALCEIDWRAAEQEGIDYIDALPERGVYIPRLDLAMGALAVAVKAPELDTAQAFAQTAIDFMTGNYEPFEDDE